MRSEHTGILEKTGHWDEALALSREILEQTAPAPVTRLLSSCLSRLTPASAPANASQMVDGSGIVAIRLSSRRQKGTGIKIAS